jgi:hypothetical protein
MFRAMPRIQKGLRPLHHAKVSWRPAGGLRRTALLVGAVGLTAGSGLITAGSAFASGSGGLEPGNLIFTPASGASSATPTWHTTDGCPVGYRHSAQMSIFTPKGVLISRISPAVYGGLTSSFSGSLEGKVSAILSYAKIPAGGNLLFVVGCYSGPGGTGNVQWVQSAVIGLASSGTSYSASAGSAQAAAAAAASGAGGAGGAGGGQSGTGSATTQTIGSEQVASTSATSTGAVAVWIAGACAIVLAVVGLVWYRRRSDRSRLM